MDPCRRTTETFIETSRSSTYVYNFLGEVEQSIVADVPLPAGKHLFGVRYDRKGEDKDKYTPIGEAALYIDDRIVGKLDGMKTQPAVFSGVGEGVCVGRDSGEPVSSTYSSPNPFHGGTIKQVTADVSGEPYRDLEKEMMMAFARD